MQATLVQINEKYGILASQERIDKVTAALAKHGIKAIVVENGVEARRKVLELIPAGAEIMNMTSMTLEGIGLAKEITDSGRYNSVRKKLISMNRETQGNEMQKLGAAPDWVIGSAHAVTEDGQVIVASATGSQLTAYAYGSSHVIWVVGSQKLVRNFDDGLTRIREYTFPLEDERSKRAYGVGSGINKMLVVNNEVAPGRITMIIVREKLGF